MEEYAPGDVVEIDLGGGAFAHVQVTHRHPSYPPVVRALRGRAAAPWSGPGPAAEAATAFTVLIPLKSALAAAGCAARLLGQAAIPPADRAFPTFRTPVRDRDGRELYYWLWDGQGLRVGEGTDAERFPQREVTGAEAFLDRLRRET